MERREQLPRPGESEGLSKGLEAGGEIPTTAQSWTQARQVHSDGTWRLMNEDTRSPQPTS